MLQMTHTHNTPQFKEERDVIVSPPSSRWGWSTSFSASFSPLSGESAIMHKERHGERQQHMSAAVDAALTGRAYRLCSSSLQAWLPLTAPTADKSGNIKENRRAAQSTHQCFFSSSPSSPPPLPKHHLHRRSGCSLYSLSSLYPTPGCQSCREREVTSQEFASSLEAHHVSGSLSCVRLPPGKLWSSPRLRTSRLLAEEGREGGREKINRMFFHLVNWQHRLLERCLSKRSVWKGFRLAEGRVGKWRHGELLSLDEVSELLRCFAWVSRKHLRCDRRASVEECLIKKLQRLRGIIFLGWSEYLCLCVCICVHTVYNYFEHPSSGKSYKSCPWFLPELVF